ncbi:hypothetical protein pdam_00017472, partial [Pocillopora damicornis]
VRVIAQQESYDNHGLTLLLQNGYVQKTTLWRDTLIRLKTTADGKENVTELSTHMSTAIDLLHLALRIQKFTACCLSDTKPSKTARPAKCVEGTNQEIPTEFFLCIKYTRLRLNQNIRSRTKE